MVVPEQDDKIFPEDPVGQWAWLDGPAPFDGDVAVLEELALPSPSDRGRLGLRRVALSAAAQGEADASRAAAPLRARLLRARKGASRRREPTAPAPLVTSASFSADGSDTARRAAQSAVAVLLRQVAATLDCKAPAPVAMRPQGAAPKPARGHGQKPRPMVPAPVAAALSSSPSRSAAGLRSCAAPSPAKLAGQPAAHSRRVLARPRRLPPAASVARQLVVLRGPGCSQSSLRSARWSPCRTT